MRWKRRRIAKRRRADRKLFDWFDIVTRLRKLRAPQEGSTER